MQRRLRRFWVSLSRPVGCARRQPGRGVTPYIGGTSTKNFLPRHTGREGQKGQKAPARLGPTIFLAFLTFLTTVM